MRLPFLAAFQNWLPVQSVYPDVPQRVLLNPQIPKNKKNTMKQSLFPSLTMTVL